MIAEPTGILEKPEVFGKKEVFYGWRWILNRFGGLPETPRIAARWWMDNVWTATERAAVLRSWTIAPPSAAAAEAAWADAYRPTELFGAGTLKGYQVFDMESLSLKQYCMTSRDAEPAACLPILLPEVAKLVEAPLNRASDTPEVFGFLVTKEHQVVFKTVHKPSAKGSLIGAECSNDSNLKHHFPRVELATELLKGAAADPIIPLLLDTANETASDKKRATTRQGAVVKRFETAAAAAGDLQHLTDLSLHIVCPYLEFLLRYMDAKRIGGRRWFLSLVDTARSTPKVKMT